MLLCTALASGCAEYDEHGFGEAPEAGEPLAEAETEAPAEDEAPDVDVDPANPELVDIDGAEAASTDPWLSWVLYAKPGQAKLVSVDPSTGVATTEVTTTNYGADWLPIGIAGSRVLWQNQSTGLMSLWTIDANGDLVTYRTYQPPSGWRVKGITLDQEGQCPLPPESRRSYTVLFERPPLPWYTPSPALWHLDDDGDWAATEYLPTSYPYNELRDFRYSPHGYGALIYKAPFAIQGDGSTIDWFGRNSNGFLERLRTDRYSATQGNAGCTSHLPGVSCFFDLNDTAPGAGYRLTSMVTTMRASGSYTPTSYLLWSKTDGTATNLRLNTGQYDGKLYSPAAPITTNNGGFEAVSETGNAYSFCPLPGDLPDPWAPATMQVIDPEACEYCD